MTLGEAIDAQAGSLDVRLTRRSWDQRKQVRFPMGTNAVEYHNDAWVRFWRPLAPELAATDWMPAA